MSVYREHRPSLALAGSVACFWTLSGDDEGPSRILPDGCMDLLFDLTGREAASVVGTMTEALISPARGGRIEILGVRFRPGEASRFLGAASARELRDQLVPLSDVWGAAAEALSDQLAAKGTLGARLSLLEATLASRSPQPVDLRVRRAVRRLHDAAGGARIGELATSVGMGERQLERLFDDRVGVGPKTLGSVFRMLALLDRVGRGTAWAEIAASLGFSDQAHLTRDLRRLAGITPTELARSLSATSIEMAREPVAVGMSDLFNPLPGPLRILGP